MLENFFNPGEKGERKWSELALRLEKVTDRMAAEGISLVAGREAFDDLLHTMGKELGFLDIEFRMLPLRRRVLQGIQILIEWMNGSWNMKGSIARDGEVITIHFLHPSEKLQVYFTEGLLQGMLTWVSGGKYYPVRIDHSDEGVKLSVAQDPID